MHTCGFCLPGVRVPFFCREHPFSFGRHTLAGWGKGLSNKVPCLSLAAWWACDPTEANGVLSPNWGSPSLGEQEGRHTLSRLCPKHVHPPSWGAPCHTHRPQESLPPHLTSFLTTSPSLATFLQHHHLTFPTPGKLLPAPGHLWLAVPSTWNLQFQTFLCTTGFFSSFQPPSEVSSERPDKISR